MNSAFFKEGESGQLKDVAPELGALLLFLRMVKSGIVIRDERSYFSEKYIKHRYYLATDGLYSSIAT